MHNITFSFEYWNKPAFVCVNFNIISVNPKRTKTVCKHFSLDFITFVQGFFFDLSPPHLHLNNLKHFIWRMEIFYLHSTEPYTLILLYV